MAKQREIGVRSRERVPSGGREPATAAQASPPISSRPAQNVRAQGTVESAVPVLRLPSEHAVARTLANLIASGLRVLSESDLQDAELAEWLGDYVKPHLDAAYHQLRKLGAT